MSYIDRCTWTCVYFLAYRGIGGILGIGPDRAVLVPNKTWKRKKNFLNMFKNFLLIGNFQHWIEWWTNHNNHTQAININHSNICFKAISSYNVCNIWLGNTWFSRSFKRPLYCHKATFPKITCFCCDFCISSTCARSTSKMTGANKITDELATTHMTERDRPYKDLTPDLQRE